ncbi:MAG: DUF3574 domain-containing protein [Lysobacteraceae bacterium]
MPHYSRLPALLLIATLASCATTAPLQCRRSEQALVTTTLYFGTGKATGAVTNEEWLGFLADSVTPRFPQGLTVTDASGQWRSADGQIVREASHALTLVHPDDAASDTAIDEIIARYKSSFAQESVLRTRSAGCVSF